MFEVGCTLNGKVATHVVSRDAGSTPVGALMRPNLKAAFVAAFAVGSIRCLACAGLIF